MSAVFKPRLGMKFFMLIGVVLSIILPSGCAGKYGKQTVDINHYRECYQPISQLRKDADDKARNTAAGAVVGGIIGGIVGYQQGKGKGAAIGAVSGAVIGGTAAYIITDQVQQKNRDERFAAYSQALDQDIKGLQTAVAAAKLTAKCYENEYKTLDRMYKSGTIGRDEMVARLTEIRAGSNDANNILTLFAAEVAENQLVYKEIQKAEAKRGSQGLSKTQMQTVSSKEKRLAAVSMESQKELEALNKLEQLCGAQLQTITAQGGPVLPIARPLYPLSICPSAGDR